MQRTLNRRWIVCGALVLFSASALLAKQGIVKTKDGRSFEGDVTEKPNGTGVVIAVRGINTTINRDDVDTIQYVGGVDEQYKQKVAALPKPPTAASHIEIAKWLFDNRSYDLAMRELEAALRIDPNNADAATLEQTIMSQKRLERSRPAPANTGTTPATGTPGATAPPKVTEGGHTATEHRYISSDDMNAIRQVEWPRDDNTVRAAVAADVRKRYVALAGENAGVFNALSPADQARKILSSDVKELRKDVKILNDPAPMADYRRTIQPLIFKGCATSGCHGGPQGGKFFLYNPPENDAASYTNFYMLTQYGMTLDGARHNMIDRNYPDSSLLAELGLPSQISKVPHPEVNGAPIRAMFKGKDDPNYRLLMNWMGKSLVLLPSPYGFDFSIDASAAPTQGVTPPSTRPTTTPPGKAAP